MASKESCSIALQYRYCAGGHGVLRGDCGVLRVSVTVGEQHLPCSKIAVCLFVVLSEHCNGHTEATFRYSTAVVRNSLQIVCVCVAECRQRW